MYILNYFFSYIYCLGKVILVEFVNLVINELEKFGWIKVVFLIRKLQIEFLFGLDKVVELNEVVRWGDIVCVYNNLVNIII